MAQWFARHGTRRVPGLNRSGDLGGRVRVARAYQRDLAEAGLAALDWPAEYGGRALGREYLDVFAAAARGYETFGDVFTIGLGMCARSCWRSAQPGSAIATCARCCAARSQPAAPASGRRADRVHDVRLAHHVLPI